LKIKKFNSIQTACPCPQHVPGHVRTKEKKNANKNYKKEVRFIIY
jgi:hypothetical protein